jgi:hypothetical protein
MKNAAFKCTTEEWWHDFATYFAIVFLHFDVEFEKGERVKSGSHLTVNMKH